MILIFLEYNSVNLNKEKLQKKRGKSLLEKFVDGKIKKVDFEDMKNEIDIEM